MRADYLPKLTTLYLNPDLFDKRRYELLTKARKNAKIGNSIGNVKVYLNDARKIPFNNDFEKNLFKDIEDSILNLANHNYGPYLLRNFIEFKKASLNPNLDREVKKEILRRCQSRLEMARRHYEFKPELEQYLPDGLLFILKEFDEEKFF